MAVSSAKTMSVVRGVLAAHRNVILGCKLEGALELLQQGCGSCHSLQLKRRRESQALRSALMDKRGRRHMGGVLACTFMLGARLMRKRSEGEMNMLSALLQHSPQPVHSNLNLWACATRVLRATTSSMSGALARADGGSVAMTQRCSRSFTVSLGATRIERVYAFIARWYFFCHGSQGCVR